LSPEIVTYDVDGSTVAQFEIDPVDGFVPAGSGDVLGRVRAAATPAIEAARELLMQAKELAPDAVQVKFGVKVTGTASWLVARAATEGNFEVTLTWQPSPGASPAPGE
jgi:NTP-dependent ternary system trypsin peptidase co-occuring protein